MRKAIVIAAACLLLAVLPRTLPAQQARSPTPAESWKVTFANEVVKWQQYSSALKACRLDDAGRILKDLESSFKSEEARIGFWSHVLPANRRHVVQFLRVCDACFDGHCKVCGGVAVCPSCSGERKCGLCNGVGVKRTACTKCLCPECHGAGFCAKCLSRKVFPCTKCEGKGFAIETESTPCAKCGGVGKISGGIKNDVMRSCPGCGGKGGSEAKKRVSCLECQGKKSMECAVCAGSGLCPSCQGKKRTGGCADCNDTRTISTNCIRCSGTGKCSDCAGKTACARCDGCGLCAACKGAKLLRVQSLPADSSWLSYSNACVVQSAANYLVDGRPVAAAGGNSLHGVVEFAGIEKVARGKVPLRLVPRKGEVLCISDKADNSWLTGALFKVSY